jgi:tetratricopeptide (TPR) repeat protein
VAPTAERIVAQAESGALKLARPSDDPGQDLVEPTRTVDAAPNKGDHLGVDDLTWSELAEAVWLAAATRPARPPTPPGPQPPSPEREVETPTEDTQATARRQGTPSIVPSSQPPDPIPKPAPVELPQPQPVPNPSLRLVTASAPVKGWSLPDRLNLIRALRPLKRYVTSRRIGDVVLDEAATAERAVQDELWLPVTKPRRERWLDLTVVVDTSPSAELWRPTVNAFVDLLEHLGAFRTIRVRPLDTNPAEVIDHSGRRVVLVITDGLAPVWRGDQIGPTLTQWAQAMPVAVIHLLPQWMWGRSGMALHRARIWCPSGLKPNRHWQVELPDILLEPDPKQAFPHGAVSIPVLELAPRWLRWWTHLMTGNHRTPVDATILITTDKPRPRVTTFESPADRSPRQRIREFRSVASPDAQRLAQLLAPLPVDLPIARLIQETFIPGSGPEIVSELITTRLLRYSADTAHHGSTVDVRAFDIASSDREILLEGARRTETARAVYTAAHHHGHRISALVLLREALTDPENTPDPTAAEDRALQRLVMRALSGPYLNRADRLDDPVLAQQSGGTSAAKLVREPQTLPVDKGANMTDAAESADLTDEPPAISAPPEIDDVPSHSGLDADIVTAPVRPTAYLGDITTKRQPGDSPPIWGYVPPRNLNFTGRDDLIEELRSQLTAGGTAAVLPATLHGMGGIGKTQTAVEYIYRHLDEYDLVWWIQASQPTQIRSGLTDLARHLNLPGSSEAHAAVPAVLEALRRGHPVRRWLLVFDAAESPESVRKFFPSNGPGEIMVTSRNPAWAGVARPLEVSVFRRDESMQLLRRRGPDITDIEADQIADKLGDLPLAIEQAAAWRAETGMPVSEYLRLFDEKVSEIFESATSPDYEVSVAAAWNVSFDALRQRNLAAHQMLQICAFFSPEPISRDLFTGVRGVSISPEVDETLRDPIRLARAIRDINRYGLAKIDHRNNTIQLHRLVQLVLRNRMTNPKLQAQMQHGAHQLLTNLDPNDPDASRNWPRYWELLPHAYAAEVVDCSDSWVRQLVINLMRFLFRWGDHDEAARLAESALKDFTAKLGADDPQTLEVAWRLGRYLWVLGRFKEAADLNQRTLVRRIQVSGENSEETFGVQASILADLKAQGDFAGAARMSEDVMLKTRRLLGDDDLESLQAAYLHAISLRLLGNFAAALALDEEIYRKRVEILGHDHQQSLASLVSIVIDRRDSGEYAWARAELEKLVEKGIEQFGAEGLITQMRVYLLSISRRKDGDHPGALELSGPTLQQFRNRYGPDHPSTVGCVLAHSIDLRHAGELAEARRLGEEAFDSYRRLLGEHHPHTLASTVDLAVTLRLSGDPGSAKELDQRALEQLRTNLGANHPTAIVSGINLASDLAMLGEINAAIELGNDMAGRAGEVHGPDHPTTLAAEVNVIFDLRTTGHDETEAQYSDVMTRYRRRLGNDHLATILASRGSRANCDIDPILL